MSIRCEPVLVSSTAAVVVKRTNFFPSVTSRTCGESPSQSRSSRPVSLDSRRHGILAMTVAIKLTGQQVPVSSACITGSVDGVGHNVGLAWLLLPGRQE
jgi:hypothetical protein